MERYGGLGFGAANALRGGKLTDVCSERLNKPTGLRKADGVRGHYLHEAQLLSNPFSARDRSPIGVLVRLNRWGIFGGHKARILDFPVSVGKRIQGR